MKNAKRKKIGIVGPRTNARNLHLYDSDWQWWGINSAYRGIGLPWKKMFNLHRLVHLERDCPQYVDWDSIFSKRNPNVEMVVVDNWGRLLKNQAIFPRKDMAYQPLSNYHSSSFDWLVAYAIHLKADVISIHGVNFGPVHETGEPLSARPCLEYWLGYARGRGVNVMLGADCESLFKQFHYVRSTQVYGYDDVTMVERRR